MTEDDIVNNYGKYELPRDRRGGSSQGHTSSSKNGFDEPSHSDDDLHDGNDAEGWTEKNVGLRLVIAFRVLDRCTRLDSPKGDSTAWPAFAVSEDDRKGWTEQDRYEELLRTAGRPGQKEIGLMEEAFVWLEDLRAHDSGMALQLMHWACWRARRRPLRKLCLRKKWALSTFERKVVKSRQWIADALIARNVTHVNSHDAI